MFDSKIRLLNDFWENFRNIARLFLGQTPHQLPSSLGSRQKGKGSDEATRIICFEVNLKLD